MESTLSTFFQWRSLMPGLQMTFSSAWFILNFSICRRTRSATLRGAGWSENALLSLYSARLMSPHSCSIASAFSCWNGPAPPHISVIIIIINSSSLLSTTTADPTRSLFLGSEGVLPSVSFLSFSRPSLLFTALHGMQSRYSDGNSVCLSVRLSVKRVHCNKTEESYV